MHRRGLIALLAAIPLAAAAPDPGVAVLERLFKEPKAQADWFTAQFIQSVPIEQVNTLLDSIRQQMGALQSVTGSGHNFVLHLDHGTVSARLVLAGDGKIAGLLLRPAATQGSLDDHVRAITSLAGETAVLVTRNDAVLAAVRAEVPLAVGSAFKLAVLMAVAQAVTQKRLAWDQVVRLDPAWRSLPSGVLQDWPSGTPVTIATLADLMISKSDNTAADSLIALAGRAAVEAISPRNAPFLTTREAFVLKGEANAALRARWRAAGLDQRRELLRQIATMRLPTAEALATEASLDIEWRFTARELAALLEAIDAVPALHINPGLANRADWRSVAYKGGSETDCVNLSTLVVAHNGNRHAVVVTWNGPGASVERLAASYTGILRGLTQQEG
jgi:beta-lactamase class A